MAALCSPYLFAALVLRTRRLSGLCVRFNRTSLTVGWVGVGLLLGGLVFADGMTQLWLVLAGAPLSGLSFLTSSRGRYDEYDTDRPSPPQDPQDLQPEDPAGPDIDWDLFDEHRRSWDRPKVGV